MSLDEFYATVLLALGPPSPTSPIDLAGEDGRAYRREFTRLAIHGEMCSNADSAYYLLRDWQWVYLPLGLTASRESAP